MEQTNMEILQLLKENNEMLKKLTLSQKKKQPLKLPKPLGSAKIWGKAVSNNKSGAEAPNGNLPKRIIDSIANSGDLRYLDAFLKVWANFNSTNYIPEEHLKTIRNRFDPEDVNAFKADFWNNIGKDLDRCKALDAAMENEKGEPLPAKKSDGSRSFAETKLMKMLESKLDEDISTPDDDDGVSLVIGDE